MSATHVFRLGLLCMVLLFGEAAAQGLPDFTSLVEANAPTIVNISTVQKAEKRNDKHWQRRMPEFPEGSPFEEWFKHYFGEEGKGAPDDRGDDEAKSQGSGFVISRDGDVLTNYHVIEDAEKIVVRLSDRRELVATVVGFDKRSDLALLKVDANDLPAVKVGRSNNLKPGEWVLAIGSPFGFDYSVTAGIVSAIGRNLPRENYVPFIQTDVAINPGNSGGPLFNLKGEVVGINSQIYSRTGGYMGVSFAIPIDVAMNVVKQLKNSGHVTRGWLGVLIQDVTRELAESFNMDRPQGALVARVIEKSPAEKAGFQIGDIILEFNKSRIIKSSDLPPVVGLTPVEETVPVLIMREGKKKTLKVRIGELPDEAELAMTDDDPEPAAANRLGVSVRALEDKERETLENGANSGVMVTTVDKGPARDAGIRRGDVLSIINNIEITNVKQFEEIVEKLPKGKPVPVLVLRRGSPIFLALKVED